MCVCIIRSNIMKLITTTLKHILRKLMCAEKEIIIHYKNLFKQTIDQATTNQPTT